MKSAGSQSMPPEPRVAPIFRLALLVSVIAVLLGAFLLREARAQLDGALLGLGSRVMAFPQAPTSEARTIQINGVEVHLRTEVVDAPLRRVLHHYRGVCSGAGSNSATYGSLVAALATRSGSTDHAGYVACATPGAGDLRTLVERLVRFSRTWNLVEVGPLRYAYATRSADRPDDQTFLLTMWADASLDLRAFLPIGEEDAKGHDLDGVPRPPRSQRILSATEASAPSGVYTYLVEAASTEEVTHRYRLALLERGWVILERNAGELVELNGIRVLSAQKDSRLLSVLAHEVDPARTTVSLLVSEAD